MSRTLAQVGMIILLSTGLSSNAFAAQVPTNTSLAASLNCQSSFDPYKQSRAALDSCHLVTSPLERINRLPDGGSEYVYTVDGFRTSYLLPPPTFNALDATAQELSFYGFPLKPGNPTELVGWESMMKNMHNVQPPAFIAAADAKFSAAANWSGYEATASCGSTCSQAETFYYEPQIYSTSCSNSAEGVWAGLGGINTGNLAQDGTAHGVPGLSDHGGFWEILPGAAHASGITAHPGYGFITSTQWSPTRGAFVFYQYDYYNGYHVSIVRGGGGPDLSTADFIIERPSVSGSLRPLSNFSSIDVGAAWVNGSGISNFSNVYSNTMYNGSDLLAYVGPLTGSSFLDYWNNCL